jgi:PTH1 family peptidyl-tRNA hydrolase
MKLIFALGNPGPDYLWTRHNLGTLLLDYYLKTLGLSTCAKDKLGSLVAETIINSEKVLFAKSTDFYNNSGLAASALLNYYKIPPENLLVLSDDLNLPFGTLRYRDSGGSGGNNGLKSIAEHLKTEDFPRLRLGTDNESRATLGDVAFVLSRFTPEEKARLPDLLQTATKKLTAWASSST